MPLPALLADLVLPVIGAPLPIVADPGLVVAQCRAGIVGALPALNARSSFQLANWLDEITSALREARQRGEAAAPYAVTHVAHPSNTRLGQDLDVCARYGVPLIFTSMAAPLAIVPAVQEWGGLVFHDVVSRREAGEAIEVGVDGLVLVCGGPRAGAVSPFAFVEAVRDVWEGPIVLSGGIGTGRTVLAAQIIGADLAVVDGRLSAAAEARAAEGYKAMLLVGGTAASTPGDIDPGDAWHPAVSADEVVPTALVVAQLRSEYYAARSARIGLGGAPAAVVPRPPLPILAAGGARG